MKSLEAAIAIKGTAGHVWSVLTDFTTFPQWNPFIREASGELAPGARLSVRIRPHGGKEMVFHPTVTIASAGRELRWLGHLFIPGLFDGEHSFRIDPVGHGEVRFHQSEQFRGILVPWFPASMYEQTRRGFELMNLALKERVETG
jgi:hypothetical protein